MSNDESTIAFDIDDPSSEDEESQNLYEVEKILDRKPNKKGFLYLVKWENFSEAQATWEPEDHLDNVKWLVEAFNANFERKQAERKRTEREKLAKLSERKRKKAEKRKTYNALDFQTQMAVGKKLDELDEDTLDLPKKTPKLSPQSATTTEDQEAAVAKMREPLQSPVSTEEVKLEMAPVRMVRGNLALDVAVKILGCRKQGRSVAYAVLFKKRNDEGVVVLPQICTHEELKVQAPWLLSQYLLDCARIEQVA